MTFTSREHESPLPSHTFVLLEPFRAVRDAQRLCLPQMLVQLFLRLDGEVALLSDDARSSLRRVFSVPLAFNRSRECAMTTDVGMDGGSDERAGLRGQRLVTHELRRRRVQFKHTVEGGVQVTLSALRVAMMLHHECCLQEGDVQRVDPAHQCGPHVVSDVHLVRCVLHLSRENLHEQEGARRALLAYTVVGSAPSRSGLPQTNLRAAYLLALLAVEVGRLKLGQPGLGHCDVDRQQLLVQRRGVQRVELALQLIESAFHAQRRRPLVRFDALQSAMQERQLLRVVNRIAPEAIDGFKHATLGRLQLQLGEECGRLNQVTNVSDLLRNGRQHLHHRLGRVSPALLATKHLGQRSGRGQQG
mmetsp:Transcript_39996/g.123591  ORF Transcript_39996/g.123591 Transcript_39996/m.123591 type:complete len:360 (-) Transcript_39996:1111-2190(-)